MRSTSRLRLLAGLVAAIAWCGLGLQFQLWIRSDSAAGRPLLLVLGQFFAYFTVLTNLLVAVVMTRAGLRRSATGRGMRRLEAATAVYMSVVGLGYSLLLRHLWTLTGTAKVADMLLHDVAPLVYVAWWLVLAEKARLGWRNVLVFLIWPLIYLVATLVDGAISGWYPYPFFDAGTRGYAYVLAVSAGFLLVLVLLGALSVAYSRWRCRL